MNKPKPVTKLVLPHGLVVINSKEKREKAQESKDDVEPS